MSRIPVRNGHLDFTRIGSHPAETTQEYAALAFHAVKACAVCGENLWSGDFVFWLGEKKLGFHPDCARHMCLGLLGDVAKMGKSLAHDYGKYR